MQSLKLMCVLAHPDDESLGMGGVLAKYAAEGVETSVVTATRGEYGWFGAAEDNPGPDALGKIREGELREAAKVLGVQELVLLDYIDGQLDQADPAEAIHKIATQMRRLKPDVVLTFDPWGAYGHPDHIAICQFTTAAVTQAASTTHRDDYAPHLVSKLYYLVGTKAEFDIYEEAMGELVMHVDGVERRGIGWPDWAITTRIDTTDYWQQVWEAVACHKTQLPAYESLKALPEVRQQALWSLQAFYRVHSLVNGGRQRETDLFEGIRGKGEAR